MAPAPARTLDLVHDPLLAALHAWGSARDCELLGFEIDLSATQVGVSSAFDQAKETLLAIVTNFRADAETMRQQGYYEAAQSVARLGQVIGEARAKFDAQDGLIAGGLRELAQRLQAVDAWARAEPARVAALVEAAPTQQRWRRSPGGTTLPPVPSTPQQAQQRDGSWDAYAAGLAAQGPAPPDAWAPRPQAAAPPGVGCGVSPQGWRQGPPHYDIASPPGFGGKGGGYGGGKGDGYTRDLRINARDWGDHRKLDSTTTYDGFHIWKDRALAHLSKERPDVRELLMWSETQSKDQLEATLGESAARLGVVDLRAVEYAVHDGIKAIVLDSLLGRARSCLGRGCELWRALSAEWHGSAPQLRDAKARSYLEPRRAKDISDLWTRLSEWERLGEEVALSNVILPEWMRNVALEKLLPTALLNTMISRSDLGEFSARVVWVKTQMEHARGLAQAAAYSPGGKDANGDVRMNSVEAAAAAPAEHAEVLAWALAGAVQQGDWAQQEALQTAILALKGSKGGWRKGGLGKGAQGKPGPGAAAPKPKFEGNCNHCGIWGHRKQDCRRLNDELGKGGKGGAKGDKGAGKGGKGGPKGGKGPPSDPLLECAAGDDDYSERLGRRTWARRRRRRRLR